MQNLKKTVGYIGCLTVLLAYIFGFIPFLVGMANAPSALANVGAVVLLLAGTIVAYYLMSILAGVKNEEDTNRSDGSSPTS